MRRRVAGKADFEKFVDEKFSMIFMELGNKDQRKDARITRKTLWHLEDEKNPAFASYGTRVLNFAADFQKQIDILEGK